MKICNKCNIEKELDCFYNKKNICKCCKKKYIKTNAIKIADYKKQYQKANAVKLAENKKEYNKTNAIKIAENKKQYQKANAVKIIEYNKKYKKDNAVKIIEYKNKYNKTKRKSDPIFRLKLNVSISINKYLKKKDLSKNNESCLQHIPYSITELKIYIESLF